MGLNDIFDDGKPEAGAARFTRTIFVHAVKALENMFLVLARNTRAVVGDLHVKIRSVALDVKLHGESGAVAVFERVLEEIEENLLEARGIGFERKIPARRGDAHGGGLGADGTIELLDHAPQQIAQIKALRLERHGT